MVSPLPLSTYKSCFTCVLRYNFDFREKERDGDDVGDDGLSPPRTSAVEIHVDEFWKDVEFAQKVSRRGVLPRRFVVDVVVVKPSSGEPSSSSSSSRLRASKVTKEFPTTNISFPKRTQTHTHAGEKEREKIRDDDEDSNNVEVVVF